MNRAQIITLAGGIILMALVNIAIPSGGMTLHNMAFYLCLFCLLLLVYVPSLMWVYQDAFLRDKSSFLVTLWVGLFFWPLGLFLWLVFRPARSRKFRRRSRRKHPESAFTVSKEYSLSSPHAEK